MRDGPTDTQLVDAYARLGDQAAFEEIVRRHAGRIHSHALRLVGDHHVAEDVLQAVFLVLSRKAAGLNAGGALCGWLHTTTRNVANHVRNKRRQDLRREEQFPARPTAHTPSAGSQEANDDRIVQKLWPRVEEALASLPRKQREAVISRYIHGASQKQAARELGCSEKSLSMRLHRGLRNLRGKLARLGVKDVGVAVAILRIPESPPSAETARAAVRSGCDPVAPLTRSVRELARRTMQAERWATLPKAVAVCLIVVLGSATVWQLRAEDRAEPELSRPAASRVQAPIVTQPTSVVHEQQTSRPKEPTPPFGQPAGGLAARLERLPDSEGRLPRFRITVKNVTNRKVSGFALDKANRWGFVWERLDQRTRQPYRGRVVGTGGSAALVHLYPSTSKTIMLLNENGYVNHGELFRADPFVSALRKHDGKCRPLTHLPAGRYRVRAGYIHRNETVNGRVNPFGARLVTNAVEVRVAERETRLGTDGFTEPMNGLGVRIELAKTSSGAPPALKVIIKNKGQTPLYGPLPVQSKWRLLIRRVGESKTSELKAVGHVRTSRVMQSPELAPGQTQAVVLKPFEAMPGFVGGWTIVSGDRGRRSPSTLGPGRFLVRAILRDMRMGLKRSWRGELISDELEMEIKKPVTIGGPRPLAREARAGKKRASERPPARRTRAAGEPAPVDPLRHIPIPPYAERKRDATLSEPILTGFFQLDWKRLSGKLYEKKQHAYVPLVGGKAVLATRYYQRNYYLRDLLEDCLRVLRYCDSEDPVEAPAWMYHQPWREAAVESVYLILEALGEKAVPTICEALSVEYGPRRSDVIAQRKRMRRAHERFRDAHERLMAHLSRGYAEVLEQNYCSGRADPSAELCAAWWILTDSLDLRERSKHRPATDWGDFHRKLKAAKSGAERHRLHQALFKERMDGKRACASETARLCRDGRRHRVLPNAVFQDIASRSAWHRLTWRLNRALGRLSRARNDEKLSRLKAARTEAQQAFIKAWNAHVASCGVGKLVRIPNEPKGTTPGSDMMGFDRLTISDSYTERLETAVRRMGRPAALYLRSRVGKAGGTLARKAGELASTIERIEEQPPARTLATVECALQRRARVALLVWDTGHRETGSAVRAAAVRELKERGRAVVRDVIAVMEAELGMGREAGEVLSFLTGKDFGDNCPAWKKWYRERGAAR